MKSPSLPVLKISALLIVLCIILIILLLPQKVEPLDDFCTRLERIVPKKKDETLAPDALRRWNDISNLAVFIDGGTAAFQNRLLNIANEWNRYCNIKFRLVANPNVSHIRVSFERGHGFASAVGTECRDARYASEPTMYLPGLDTLQDRQKFTRIILHEFGHALGLEHELRKPSAKINWDSTEVYRYYRDLLGWSETDVNENIFTPFTVPPEYEEFDSSSIMAYPVPAKLTKDSTSIPWPIELSPTDTSGIKKWYPKNL